ncbi:hypothetical protein J1605_006804 [Eschrichtius robustus]|uniref:Uncharacterized protein n=1 Tax=Eschrichtius robustus TaxID=9764 RepID=A0AB34H2D4_ESCRO|nr:hypothetical protein J1605_006804 [Eschrichtius robustus]
MLGSIWPTVTTEKVHVLLVSRRNENLQTGAALPHTCLIRVFNDLLLAHAMNSLPTLKNWMIRASLVAQWLRIRLLMQGIRVRALVWEDPTCRGATGPVSHNY